MMRLIVALFGMLIASFGAFGLIRPADFVGLVRHFWATSRGAHYAAALRLALGLALLLAAADSAYPRTLTALGYLSIAGAVIILLLGHVRLAKIIEWWAQQPETAVRLWGFLALAVGIFLIAAVR
ncbi:hypothetical protein [Methylococcus geothermalis]|uniref:hypothetical protein n=1 Tax=Methylococcus geothermalis TaxID=2681310 RepID=UPI001E55447E|nr:hypothetical protein [Methylococcus geothermalis]